jgi:hypothetical protein
MTALASPPNGTGTQPRDHGRFRWEIHRGTAVWSDSVYRRYGYEPGAVIPSPALGLGHKHPDDLHGCVDALHAGMLANRLIVHEHRVVDVRGAVSPVVMVARGSRDDQGCVRALYGFLLPLSAVPDTTDAPAPERGSVALVRAVRTAFDVDEEAAAVLLEFRRPLSARRPAATPIRRPTIERGGQLGRILADSMFPLDHLIGTGTTDGPRPLSSTGPPAAGGARGAGR